MQNTTAKRKEHPYFALVPIQYIIPFSSKSCWCLNVKVWPSRSFLTKINEDLSKSYHCLATCQKKRKWHKYSFVQKATVREGKTLLNRVNLTILRRYCSRDSTVASGSIFSIRPVRSMSAVSPGARSRRKRNLLVRICITIQKCHLSATLVCPSDTVYNFKSHWYSQINKIIYCSCNSCSVVFMWKNLAIVFVTVLATRFLILTKHKSLCLRVVNSTFQNSTKQLFP